MSVNGERTIPRLRTEIDGFDLIAGGGLPSGRSKVIRIRPELLDARSLIGRGVECVQPLVSTRRHGLEVSVPPQPLWLEADPTRLEQVLVNLLIIPAKFTEPGGRIALAAQHAGDEVIFSVADSAAGIAPTLLTRVFDVFAEVDDSLDRARGGPGIGLALLRTLVQMHGGRVEAASDGPGRGSTLTVDPAELIDLIAQPH